MVVAIYFLNVLVVIIDFLNVNFVIFYHFLTLVIGYTNVFCVL